MTSDAHPAAVTASRRTRSHEAFARARRLIPGGVNSPARAFGGVGGEPIFFKTATGQRLTTLLRELVDTRQQTIVLVTHDPTVAEQADRIVHLADGRIAREETRRRPSPATDPRTP